MCAFVFEYIYKEKKDIDLKIYQFFNSVLFGEKPYNLKKKLDNDNDKFMIEYIQDELYNNIVPHFFKPFNVDA